MVIPQLNIKQLSITNHGHKRVLERFKVRGNSTDTLNFCKSILSQMETTKFVGKTTCEMGNDSYLFSNGRIGIHISPDLLRIVTVVDLLDKAGHYVGWKDKIKKLYDKELSKIERIETAKSKKLTYLRIKENVDIAPIKLRMYKSRSTTVKVMCEQEILNLTKESRELEETLKIIQSNKRAITRAIATVII